MNSKVKTAEKHNVGVLASWKRDIAKNYDLYLISIPAFVVIIVFYYFPMYGVQLAFKNFIASKGILGSPWVGFEHFHRLFSGYNFERILKNTLVLSLYQLCVGFPLPVIFALMLNEVGNKAFKKSLQMISYAPNFISVVVMVAMLNVFLASNNGCVNMIISKLGFEKIEFLTSVRAFKHIYVWSEIWQTMGYNAIIYISALSSIDPQLHEAVKIDGANKLQKIWHVDLPGILPTVVILLILNAGRIMNVGFDKAFLLQNDMNREVSDIISTYVYRMGILGGEYSFSTAVGLFNSVINFILLISVNWISGRLTDSTLW